MTIQYIGEGVRGLEENKGENGGERGGGKEVSSRCHFPVVFHQYLSTADFGDSLNYIKGGCRKGVRGVQRGGFWRRYCAYP